jgi:hypothetical protein
MPKNTSPMNRPMRIQARKGSLAEKYYYEASALPGGKLPIPKAIAPGISPAPLEDLVFHGGKIVRQMEFQNIYLGRETDWVGTDRSSIDDAITRAMRDQHLNNVVIQYFHGFPENKMTCDPRASIVFGEPSSPNIGEPNVQAIATRLINEGRVKNSNLDSIIFNLILPRGIVLELDDSSSLNGLGGYHGSVHIPLNGQQVTIYYSANVFSELQPNGTENGIAVYDTPWKNVVGPVSR